jgi:hypothetical protein
MPPTTFRYFSGYTCEDMSSEATDLWPDDIGIDPEERLPIDVMREQARLLGEKTHGIVRAQVRTEPWDFRSWVTLMASRSPRSAQPGKFDTLLRHEFVLGAPKLPGYEYLLFFVIQPPALYPVEIVTDDDVIEIAKLDAFENVLRTIFTSPETRKIIAGLLAQSRSA